MRAMFVVVAFAMSKFVLLASASEDFLLAHSLTDDAFYYLEIARNAWITGLFPTFDGIHLTNGFHYLYQLLLVGLTPLLPTALVDQYRALALLHGLFFCVGLLALAPVLRRYFRPRTAQLLLCFMGLGGFAGKIVATGMESSLAFMLASWFLYCALVRRAGPVLLGALLGLLVLARSDVGALFALTYAYTQRGVLTPAGRDAGQLKHFLTVALVAACLVVPMPAWNQATFGHMGTISSSTKAFVAGRRYRSPDGSVSARAFVRETGIAAGTYGRDIVSQTFGDVLALPHVAITGVLPSGSTPGALASTLKSGIGRATLALAPCVLVALWLARRRGPNAPGGSASFAELAPYVLAVPVVHLLAVSAILGRQGGRWYWMFMVLGIGAACAYIADRWPRLTTGATFTLALVAVTGLAVWPASFVLGGAASPGYRETSWYSGARATAAYLNDTLVPGTRAGSFNGGFIGYLSENPLISMDGLANDWEMLHARKTDTVRDYLTRKNIEYIADVGAPDAYLKYMDQMHIRQDEYELVFRSPDRMGFVVRLDLQDR